MSAVVHEAAHPKLSRPAARLTPYALALISVFWASCGGQSIRLGDEPLASAGMAPSDAADAGECERGRVMASEVLWIGDSWIIDPGTQQDSVTDFARAAKTIGESEEYPSSAAAGASMAMIAQQYEARQLGSPRVKVLLMDGGTWDPIAAQMTGGSVPDAIDKSVATFEAFLLEVASDATVEHIVYFLVPKLKNIPGVAEMRPRLRQACADSRVPCHFIDLQDIWQAGDPARYTAVNGFQASADGGRAIGEAIWATMREHCIAQ